MKRSVVFFGCCIGLVLVTFIAFEPIRKNEFINYDDVGYVTENPHVQGRITGESIVWAFTSVRQSNWHPLTWLSHMLDCQLFGLDPFWHHMVNLLFHIANTVLLFMILQQMTGAIWRSVFVAALFAVHPLHVESVAWLAERKDVLSGFFWMLTIAAYIRYVKRPGVGGYLLVFVSFCLGLMAKPMLVTLPFVLLLLDYWPLRRFQLGSKSQKGDLPQSSADMGGGRVSVFRLIAEKIPLFALVVASSVITFIAQRSGGAVVQLKDWSVIFRIADSLFSYVSYLVKMFYPTDLAMLYPYPETMNIGVHVLLLIGLSIWILRQTQRRPWLGVGWLWYLGTLVPVIGLVQVGPQIMADRYTYLPSIGVFILVAWGAAELAGKWRWRYVKAGLGITAIIVVTVLLICTRKQVGYWKDSLTLYEHTLSVTEKNHVILNNYGLALRNKGRFDEALIQFRKVLEIKPNKPNVHYNIGYVLTLQGKLDEAVSEYHKVLQIAPDHPALHYRLGVIFMQQGRHNEAIKHFNKALQRLEILDLSSVAHADVGTIKEAIVKTEKALKQEELAQDISRRPRFYKTKQP